MWRLAVGKFKCRGWLWWGAVNAVVVLTVVVVVVVALFSLESTDFTISLSLSLYPGTRWIIPLIEPA